MGRVLSHVHGPPRLPLAHHGSLCPAPSHPPRPPLCPSSGLARSVRDSWLSQGSAASGCCSLHLSVLSMAAGRPLEARGGCEPLHSPAGGPPGGFLLLSLQTETASPVTVICSPLWGPCPAVRLPWGPGAPTVRCAPWLPLAVFSFSFGGPANSDFGPRNVSVSAPPESLRRRLLRATLRRVGKPSLGGSRAISLCPSSALVPSPRLPSPSAGAALPPPAQGGALKGPHCPGNVGRGCSCPGSPFPRPCPQGRAPHTPGVPFCAP